VLCINLIGKLTVGAGLFTGYYLGIFVPENIGSFIGFLILFSLGIIKTVQWLFSSKKVGQKKNISWSEAIILGFVLSFDGSAMAVGAMTAAMPCAFIVAVLGISVFTDQIVFVASQYIGKNLIKKANLDLGWLSGFAIMIVAVTKFALELFT
jgi:putative Mn2+ efflux pump MntP